MKKIYNLQFTIYNSKKGFTLIELLVVIGIIGILSGLLMANFIGVRQRSRDGTRKSNLSQIQSALELYRSDLGSYPSPLPACGNQLTSGGVVYMQKIPCDPQSAASYGYDSAGTTYCLRGCLENSNDGERDELPAKYGSNDPVLGCTLTCGIAKSFTLQNP